MTAVRGDGLDEATETLPTTGRAVFGDGQLPDDRQPWRGTFELPRLVLRAAQPSDVHALVRAVDAAARTGAWAVVALTYEAAPAFDPALAVRTGSRLGLSTGVSGGSGPRQSPWLAWAAIYDGPVSAPVVAPHDAPSITGWAADVSDDLFARRVDSILACIAAGDTYQVNLTFALRGELRGDAFAWYRQRQRYALAPYAACIDTGDSTLVSLSPELFFERTGSRVVTRPMKGTAPRGRWPAEDEARRQALVASEKARAENVMIVDLLRNDLGRVATTGSVEVHDLCTAERYPTVWQLTSTIAAEVPRDCPLWDVLAALFPCGSVTGAPKVRTMEIIAAHESSQRGVYTGAIGLVRPGGDAVFSVPIRTLVVDHQSQGVTLGIGAGITADSDPHEEYAECLIKARFAGDDAALRLPGLFETLRLEGGAYWLRSRHLARLQASAAFLDMPCDAAMLNHALDEAARARPSGCWRVRLVLRHTGEIECHADPFAHDPVTPWRVAFAAVPVDAQDRRLFHKTLDRALYDQARAGLPACDDVLLWNEAGLVTESTVANLVVEIDGTLWTPPVEDGLLPGTLRAHLLAGGELRERSLTQDDVRRAPRVWLINSLRGWVDVRFA